MDILASVRLLGVLQEDKCFDGRDLTFVNARKEASLYRDLPREGI